RTTRGAVYANQPVAHETVRIVEVLLDESPGPAPDIRPVDSQEVLPRICPAEHFVAGHDRRERAEGHAASRKTGRDKSALGRLADVRQTIIRLNHLPGPVAIHMRPRDQSQQPPL